MKSKTRLASEEAEEIFSQWIKLGCKDISNPTMLMIGTAGNPRTHNGKPGLDHPQRFSNFKLTTVDFDPKWEPDIVCDIASEDAIKNSKLEKYDLIHMTQVIEHIPNLMDVPKCLQLLAKGYLIVDCPWGPDGPDYHGEMPSFGDFWRISKDGMRSLFKDYFDIITIIDTSANTSCLMKVKK